MSAAARSSLPPSWTCSCALLEAAKFREGLDRADGFPVDSGGEQQSSKSSPESWCVADVAVAQAARVVRSGSRLRPGVLLACGTKSSRGHQSRDLTASTLRPRAC